MNLNRCAIGGAVLSIALVVVGCSSSSMPMPNMDAGMASHDAGSAGRDAGTATPPDDSGTTAADTGTTGGKPATPAVVSAEKLAGGLHVVWKLNDTGLTAVELWRKKDQGTFARVFSLPGTAVDQHDEGATAPGTYCFQVKTFRGTAESDFSPEKCGTP